MLATNARIIVLNEQARQVRSLQLLKGRQIPCRIVLRQAADLAGQAVFFPRINRFQTLRLQTGNFPIMLLQPGLTVGLITVCTSADLNQSLLLFSDKIFGHRYSAIQSTVALDLLLFFEREICIIFPKIDKDFITPTTEIISGRRFG